MSVPLAALNPAWKAADWPLPEPWGVLVIETHRTQGWVACSARTLSLVVSLDPSSTMINSKGTPEGMSASPTCLTSSKMFSSSLWAGATTERVGVGWDECSFVCMMWFRSIVSAEY